MLAAADQLVAVPVLRLALVGAPAVVRIRVPRRALGIQRVCAPVRDRRRRLSGRILDAAKTIASSADIPEVHAVAVVVEIEVAHLGDLAVAGEHARHAVLLHQRRVDAHRLARLRAGHAGAVDAAAERRVVPLDEDDLARRARGGELLRRPVPLRGADVVVGQIAERIAKEPRAVRVAVEREVGVEVLPLRRRDIVVARAERAHRAERDDRDGAVVGAVVEVLRERVVVRGEVEVGRPLVARVLDERVRRAVAAAVVDAVVADRGDERHTAEEVVVLACVVAPELVPAALALVRGAFDQVASEDQHVGVARLDELDVLPVAAGFGEEVGVLAAAGAGGTAGAARNLRRRARPLAEARAAEDEGLAVRDRDEPQVAAGVGRRRSAEGVRIARRALRDGVGVLGVGLEAADRDAMAVVARGDAGRGEDRGGREGERARCVEFRGDLVVEDGDEDGCARGDDRRLEAGARHGDRAGRVVDREPGELHPVEGGVHLVGENAEVGGRLRGRRRGDERGERGREQGDRTEGGSHRGLLDGVETNWTEARRVVSDGWIWVMQGQVLGCACVQISPPHSDARQASWRLSRKSVETCTTPRAQICGTFTA